MRGPEHPEERRYRLTLGKLYSFDVHVTRLHGDPAKIGRWQAHVRGFLAISAIRDTPELALDALKDMMRDEARDLWNAFREETPEMELYPEDHLRVWNQAITAAVEELKKEDPDVSCVDAVLRLQR